jgi:hypothetical protein
VIGVPLVLILAAALTFRFEINAAVADIAAMIVW